MSAEHIYDLALARCDGIGPRIFSKLHQYFGDSRAVFAASDAQIGAVVSLRPRTLAVLRDPDLLAVARLEWDLAAEHGIRLLFPWDADFPTALAQSIHCPLVLSVRGQIPHQCWTAVVGTRRPSSSGLDYCSDLASVLADRGHGLVSGLAYGIDRHAHRVSLDCGVVNVAVLGQGLLGDLDPGARGLAKEMIDGGGALVSQFSLWAPAERRNFPIRNGVIAGLSDQLCLIESQIRGGAMITAHMTLEDRRTVYAWAGRPPLSVSAGPVDLLSSGLASDLDHWCGFTAPTQFDFGSLDECSRNLLKLLQNPTNLDQIILAMSMPASQVLTLLTQLEIRGLVASMPGRYYTALVNYESVPV